ncbi:MAG: hypothetical protein HC918_02090 [Oscillatoriales cyanobacterium SM2_1_8]|nr:hypothetical protein [Oscillatoriales cyanobacterium SM2_1_8]
MSPFSTPVLIYELPRTPAPRLSPRPAFLAVPVVPVVAPPPPVSPWAPFFRDSYYHAPSLTNPILLNPAKP